MMGLSRRMRWLIGLSIALNLFLLTFIGAQIWRLHRAARMMASGAGIEMVLRQVSGRLSADDSQALRQGFVPKLPELDRLQHQALENLARIRGDLATEPFDPAKLRTDMDAADATRNQIALIVEQALLDALPHLSADGRRKLSHFRLLGRR